MRPLLCALLLAGCSNANQADTSALLKEESRYNFLAVHHATATELCASARHARDLASEIGNANWYAFWSTAVGNDCPRAGEKI